MRFSQAAPRPSAGQQTSPSPGDLMDACDVQSVYPHSCTYPLPWVHHLESSHHMSTVYVAPTMIKSSGPLYEVLSLTSSPAHPSWLSCSSSSIPDMLPPQGLCTCLSLCLKHSSPGICIVCSLTSFRSLKCHLLKESFLNHSI